MGAGWIGHTGLVPRHVTAVVAAVAAVVCLLAGFVFAQQLGSALAVRFEDKTLPPEPTTTVVAASELAPIAPVAQVDLPEGAAVDPLLTLAVDSLQEAAGTREHTGPGLTVVVEVIEDGPAEEFTASLGGTTLTVEGSRRGAAQGLFRLADAAAGGRDWADVADGVTRSPALPHRFVDTGAIGTEPDRTAYLAQDDYAHTSGALENVVLDAEPWIDAEGLDRAAEDWRQFVDHVVSYGYNGVYVAGFLEYVSFDTVGDGLEVYPEDHPERHRQAVLREQVGELWRYADQMGLDVVFKTDMLALSGPLEDYLERELGGIDANDPRLWEVYRAGLEEFFTTFPWADGLMIRIGEGGAIYNPQFWDYYSALAITDPQSVQTMLRTAAEVAAGHDATIYFRTWSVGVGDVGDMHTNPQTYERVLGDLDLPNLVVSTKFTMGDFDSFLPLNPTLLAGEHARVVELQGRREFEAFSAIPNDVGPTHQAAVQAFLAGDGDLQGLWLWTQDGGPWRAGPMSLYLKEGFWEFYDLNVYTGGLIGWDPDVDLSEANRRWVTRMLTSDPASVDAVTELLSLSRSAVLDGLYISPYAEQAVFALGLEPPPMMWLFKWDIVSGDSAALSAVYLGTRDRIDEALTEGERAVATAQQMRQLLLGVERDSFHDPELYDALLASVDYTEDLFVTLGAFREAFLRYYQWVDTGSPDAYDAWRTALVDYRAASAAHTQRWTGDLDLPPQEFFAADVGMRHAERAGVARAASWGLLALSLGGLALVPALRRGAFTPWRLRQGLRAAPAWQRWSVVLLPVVAVVGSRLTFSAAASTAYLLVTLGSIALLAVVARVLLLVLRPGADGWALGAALGGALLLRTVLLTGAMSFTGPGGYWFRFWTDDLARTLYVAVATAALLWVLVVVALVLRSVYGVGLLGAVGPVLAGVGVPLLALGALISGVGLEQALTTINDQMAVLPLGLSRILGIVTHLGIPTALPSWLVTSGTVLAVLGVLACLPEALRRRRRPRHAAA